MTKQEDKYGADSYFSTTRSTTKSALITYFAGIFPIQIYERIQFWKFYISFGNFKIR